MARQIQPLKLAATVLCLVVAPPPPLQAADAQADQALDCRALEEEMRGLATQTYSYKPGFYEDTVHGTALWLGVTSTVAPIVSYGLFGYSGYVEYQENRRIITAQDRMERLRQLKAERRCFEG